MRLVSHNCKPESGSMNPEMATRLMEIDPRYADCIVRRWQEYTCKNAVLDGDGRGFEQVAEERMRAAA